MATLHSHEFFSGRITAFGTSNLYTVPAGYLIVLKAASFNNSSSGSKVAQLQVDGTWVIANRTLAANANFVWSGWVALQAGHVVQAFNGVAGALDVNVSGYLYYV